MMGLVLSQSLSKLRRLAGRGARLALLIPAALYRAGGVRRLSKRVMQVYQQSGWRGIASTTKAMLGGSAPLHRVNYGRWRMSYDAIDESARAVIRKSIATMKAPPLISVLMPVYNPKDKFLREALDSVLGQLYPHWELCIADDASPNPSTRAILQEYASRDARIKLALRTDNGHICAASNSALALASGSWIALMDHDDLLAEQALFCLAEAVCAHPLAQLVYSDEDKIDDRGKRFAPYFKPCWNWELLYAQNFFSHLGAYRTELIRSVGGFRMGLEGAQDHDLVLRCAERLDPATQILHIPRVLYHWRVHGDSTADSLGAKPYAQLAGIRALEDHFARIGVRAHVDATPVGYRVHYALPETLPLVSLIIPTRNAQSLVRQCIESIEARTRYPRYEILLVDNGSDDSDALEYFSELQARNPCVRVLRDSGPFNFAALNNMAVEVAKGEIVALINNDIEAISPEWLSEMVGIALQPGVGAVGARLWYPNGTLQHGGIILGVGGVAGHSHKHLPNGGKGYFMRAVVTQSVSAVTAACLVIRKSIYREVGGLDAANLKVAFNDVDFCLRVREAGYRNVWTPYAELFHHESATRGDDLSPERKARYASEFDYMQRRWGAQLHDDPAYSPNLTLQYEDFSYAWPPRVPPLGT